MAFCLQGICRQRGTRRETAFEPGLSQCACCISELSQGRASQALGVDGIETPIERKARDVRGQGRRGSLCPVAQATSLANLADRFFGGVLSRAEDIRSVTAEPQTRDAPFADGSNNSIMQTSNC